jgi:phenylalanyl-tRNA synthetase beta chain
MNVLRPSLLPGLLDSLRNNLSRKIQNLALFELGRVFSRETNSQFREERRIAVAITGQHACSLIRCIMPSYHKSTQHK